MRSFDTVAIIGVGLIGGSIGLSLRKRGLAREVIGIGRRGSSLLAAERVGAVSRATVDLAEGVARADLVVVASPVASIVDHVRQAAEAGRPELLITDTGSVKRPIVESLDERLPRGCRFLGSHPLAGGEKAGPAHADAELFEGRLVVVTPTPNTRSEDLDSLERFWSELGAVVERMPADEHDRALAVTSHLPHALAATLAAVLPETYAPFVASGFLSTSRLASGAAELWSQIFQMNGQNLVEAIGLFQRQLDTLRTALTADDPQTLDDLLTTAKKVRDALGN